MYTSGVTCFSGVSFNGARESYGSFEVRRGAKAGSTFRSSLEARTGRATTFISESFQDHRSRVALDARSGNSIAGSARRNPLCFLAETSPSRDILRMQMYTYVYIRASFFGFF